jgi:hypothetical protein
MTEQCKQLFFPGLEFLIRPSFAGPGPGRGHKKKSNTNDAVLDRWNEPGAEGFFAWLSDMEPRILKADNRYSSFEPEDWQRKEIEKMLAVDKHGNRKHSLCMLCWSRRHSKSIINCLVTLHLFCTQQNWLALCLANKLDQVLSVNFKLLVDTIRHSPKLLKLIGDQNIYADRIFFPPFNNQIMAVSNTMAGAFGQKVSCLWATEIHVSPDLKPFRAMLASLVDSENSLCLIDTNTDSAGGPVEEIEKQAKTDPSIFCSRIEYKNFEEFKRKVPSWINRSQVAQHKALQLPSEFARDYLNLRVSARNSLFTAETIRQCKTDYKYPVEDVNTLLDGRAHVIGAGLDRAKSLIKSPTSDASVWTVVAKTVALDGQPEFYVLNQKVFRLNTSKNIKATILEDHERYNIKNAIFEHYETGDLAPFMADHGISVELMSATPSLQNAVFPELHRLCSNGKMHFPKGLKTLASEMSTFVYEQTKNGLYKFQHSSQKFHDDTVFSLAYAVHSVRASILNLYEMGNIQCKNKSSRRRLCFLLGGNLTLLCAEQCQAFQECKLLFQEYKKFQMDSELSIEEFYQNHVKRVGCLIQQAA